MRYRLIIAILISLAYGGISAWYHVAFARGAGDIDWAMCAARALAAGAAPYQDCPTIDASGGPLARYPLTTALVVAPLAWLPGHVAAGIFVGLSAGLLAWGLLGTGQPWRLLVLLSFPAIACLQVANWSLVLLAGLSVPGLAVLAVAKPHAGLPVFVARAWHAPGRYLVPTGLIVLVSLALRPTWPLEFLGATTGYTGRPILLTLPFGPLLLLALLRWRDPRARYLLLCAIVPLRPFYDWLLIAPVFASRRWLTAWIVAGWAGYAAFYLGVPALAAPLIWGPALAAVLRRCHVGGDHAVRDL